MVKLRFYILGLLGALLSSGCASRSVPVTRSQDLHSLVGKRVMLVGTASHNCPGAMLFDGDHLYVFIDGMKYWPTNYDRRRVQVVGLLAERHSPDLYVIRNAKWNLLP